MWCPTSLLVTPPPTKVRLEASGVVGDNLWLWRADHSQLAPGEPPKTYDTTQDGRADEAGHTDSV